MTLTSDSTPRCHADANRSLERTSWDTSQIYSIPGLFVPPAGVAMGRKVSFVQTARLH
jgi:hypothetical protein